MTLPGERAIEGPASGYDTFVTKFSAAGDHLWTTQTGTSEDDFGNAIAVDAAGNSYSTARTTGSGYSVKLSPSGEELWRLSFGARGVAVYADRLYLAGGSSLQGVQFRRRTDLDGGYRVDGRERNRRRRQRRGAHLHGRAKWTLPGFEAAYGMTPTLTWVELLP